MRWFGIRKAKIDDPEYRKTFERYGTVGMQIALGDMNHFVHKGQTVKAQGKFLFGLGVAHRAVRQSGPQRNLAHYDGDCHHPICQRGTLRGTIESLSSLWKINCPTA